MSSSMGRMTSHIWNGKWKMFQTTNQMEILIGNVFRWKIAVGLLIRHGDWLETPLVPRSIPEICWKSWSTENAALHQVASMVQDFAPHLPVIGDGAVGDYLALHPPEVLEHDATSVQDMPTIFPCFWHSLGKKTNIKQRNTWVSKIQKMLALPRLEAIVAPPLPWHGGWLAMEELAVLIFGAPKPLEDMMARCKTFQDPKGWILEVLIWWADFDQTYYGILAATKSEICRKAFILTHQRSSVVSVRT